MAVETVVIFTHLQVQQSLYPQVEQQNKSQQVNSTSALSWTMTQLSVGAITQKDNLVTVQPLIVQRL